MTSTDITTGRNRPAVQRTVFATPRAAEFLELSHWTVRDYIREGLPAFKVGSGAKAPVRIRAADLAKLLTLINGRRGCRSISARSISQVLVVDANSIPGNEVRTMIDHTNGPPGDDRGGGPTAETADHTTNTIKHHQDGCSHSSGLVVFDWRLAAWLTEPGLQPVDVALTFTGLAAEMAALTERIGVM